MTYVYIYYANMCMYVEDKKQAPKLNIFLTNLLSFQSQFGNISQYFFLFFSYKWYYDLLHM